MSWEVRERALRATNAGLEEQKRRLEHELQESENVKAALVEALTLAISTDHLDRALRIAHAVLHGEEQET